MTEIQQIFAVIGIMATVGLPTVLLLMVLRKKGKI